MNETAIKGLFAAALAAIGVYFRALIVPVVILIVVMALDYLTGMARAWAGKELSSRVGILGIIKKLCYLVGVAVAVVVDWVIQTAGSQLGHDLSGFYLCGLLVTVWLVLNECISILENVQELGVPIPAFLMALLARLKKQTEQEGETALPGGGGHVGD